MHATGLEIKTFAKAFSTATQDFASHITTSMLFNVGIIENSTERAYNNISTYGAMASHSP